MFNKKKILKKYQFFLIDLDGVIFDSKKNMNASWNECMKKFYLKQNFKQYFNYLGLPISDILKKIGIKRNIQNITSCYQTFSEKNLKLVKPYITVIKTLKFSNSRLFDTFNIAKSIWNLAYDNIDLYIKKNRIDKFCFFCSLSINERHVSFYIFTIRVCSL